MQELDAAVKSRISFSSIGSMTLWPSSYAPEKATLEHLVQENKELRQQIDSSQINMSYSKMLKYFDEHTTVYVAPDRELAKRCTQLAAENERQAAQIATLSTQLSDSASASHAMHERQWHPGSGLQRQSQAKGTQDLSGNQQASTAYKAAPIKTDLQVSSAPSTLDIVPSPILAPHCHRRGFNKFYASTNRHHMCILLCSVTYIALQCHQTSSAQQGCYTLAAVAHRLPNWTCAHIHTA